MSYKQTSEVQTELVIGIIGPIGCNREMVLSTIEKISRHYSYNYKKIGLSELIAAHVTVPQHKNDQFIRVTNLMSAGNKLRSLTNDNSIMAKMAASEIARARDPNKPNTIYVIDSIKHPEEVIELRNIYNNGFYLLAVHSSEQDRNIFLEKQCHIKSAEKRQSLIDRDKDEKIGYGQSTSEAFHLADYFLTEDGNNQKVWNSVERFFDLIFGDPFQTPTFDEYAMFMAYSSSTKSADLSRQVGAVITTMNDIISTGANECPKPGGGTYWPLMDSKNKVNDSENGRDYKIGFDHNAKEKLSIIESLLEGIDGDSLEKLKKNINTSGINDLTEYGRVVHAEMDAILSCARKGISCEGGVIFCTTFPCHNCAKHIIASGIRRVIYIEPYPKSKALSMHKDALCEPDNYDADKVIFEPFIGVGPRLFIDLFSLNLSSGARIKRKKSGGYKKTEWDRAKAYPRLKMHPFSYTDNEKIANQELDNLISPLLPISLGN